MITLRLHPTLSIGALAHNAELKVSRAKQVCKIHQAV